MANAIAALLGYAASCVALFIAASKRTPASGAERLRARPEIALRCGLPWILAYAIFDYFHWALWKLCALLAATLPLAIFGLPIASEVIVATHLILYPIRQWILGWPDQAIWMLKPGALGGSGALDGLIGKSGVALTPLKPTGYALFDGLRRDAIAEAGVIEAGAQVEARGRRGFQVVVRVIASEGAEGKSST